MGLCDSVWVTPVGAPSIAVVVFVGSVQQSPMLFLVQYTCYTASYTIVVSRFDWKMAMY